MDEQAALEIIKTFADYQLFTDITDLTAKYVRKPKARIDGYFMTPYPQRLVALNETLKMWILREEGRIDDFLAFSKRMNALEGRVPSEKDKHIVAMIQWLREGIDEIPHHFTGDRQTIVLGLMAWGGFVDKMLEVLFKTWLAPGNMEALCARRRVIIHVITTLDGMRKIKASQAAQAISVLGALIQFHLLPAELAAGPETYWLIGAGVSLQLAFARRMGAAYHHAMPDFVYARGYFESLLKLAETHDNIVMGALDTEESLLLKSLEPYGSPSCIDVAPSDLASLALNAVHICDFFSLVNTRAHPNLMPLKYRIAWEGEDRLYMASPHLEPVYLSEKTIAGAPDRFFMSIDSEMDFLIPDMNFYIPQAGDNLFLCGMTAQSARLPNAAYIDKDKYWNAMWGAVKMRDSVKFFFRGESHLLTRSLRPNIIPMSNASIEAEQAELKANILENDPWKDEPVPRKRHLV